MTLPHCQIQEIDNDIKYDTHTRTDREKIDGEPMNLILLILIIDE